jgi:hypothetical protein
MAKRRRKVRLLIDERDFDEAEAQLERWKASGEDAGGLRELQAYLEANASWWTESNTGMKFRRIPGGSFRMGSPSSEEGRGSNERQHTVSVGKFWMGVNEVTLGQFRRFVRDSGHRPKSESKGCFWYTGSKWEKSKNKNWRSPGFSQLDSQPVVCVSWFDASAYAKWLTKKTGKHFRLPTEAEWEYAARAGTQTARYWGEAIGRNRANCYECGSRWDGKQTAPAGSSPPQRLRASRHAGQRVGVDVFSLYCKLRWQRTKVFSFRQQILPSRGFAAQPPGGRAFRQPGQRRAGFPELPPRISSSPGLTLFPFPKTPAWAKGASAPRISPMSKMQAAPLRR